MTESLPAPPDDLLEGCALFLDFDGTLVELHERPDAVVVEAALAELVAALGRRLDGRLAIVSGRAASEIVEFFAGSAPVVSGSHGLEVIWPDGRSHAPLRPAALDSAAPRAAALRAAHPGVFVEDKPFGLGLHFRQAPEAEAACFDLACSLAEGEGLELQAGKMLYEVRASGADKGAAVRRLMDDAPMRGRRPIFVGDDVTDETAFAAAAALGGAGVLVGPARETAARYRLDDVAATLAWLGQAARAPA